MQSRWPTKKGSAVTGSSQAVTSALPAASSTPSPGALALEVKMELVGLSPGGSGASGGKNAVGALSPEQPSREGKATARTSALPITLHPDIQDRHQGSSSPPSNCTHRRGRCGEGTFQQGVHLKPKS